MGCCVQQSWLELAEDDGKFSRKWVVLDNGVLWIYRDQTFPGQAFAEQVIPLHDAEICCPAPSSEETPEASLTIAVRLCREHGRCSLVSLRAFSEPEYSRWVTVMLESARLWRVRRQTVELRAPDHTGSRPHQSCVDTPIEAAKDAAGGTRQGVGVSLVRLSDQCAALRQATRHAVTQCLCDDLLPRFHRRAIAAAVDKVWKVSERARQVLNQALSACPEGNGTPSIYDAILVIRGDVPSFLTYCGLLQDLKLMLRNDCIVLTDESLSTSPIRALSALRDALRKLGPLLQGHPEQRLQRAALAAVDSTLHSCWSEIREQHSSLFAAKSSEPSSAPTADGGARTLPDDVLYYIREHEQNQLDVSGDAACLPFKPSSSMRRLASRLRPDVVRQSVRRARKRARSDCQFLLDDGDATHENVPMAVFKTLTFPGITCEKAERASGGGQNRTTEHRSMIKVAEEKPNLDPLRPPAPPRPAKRRPLPQTPDEKGLAVCPAFRSNDVSDTERGLLPLPPAGNKVVGDPDDLERIHIAGTTVADNAGCHGQIEVGTGECVCYGKIFNYSPLVAEGEYEAPVTLKGASSATWTPQEAWTSADFWHAEENVEENIYEEIEEEVRCDGKPGWRRDDLLEPVTPATPNGGGRRTLWCETSEVQRSGLQESMSPAERALQEAKFEVLSSEESYLRSLDMLAQRVNSLADLQDTALVTDHDRDTVTSYLDLARACSLRFVSSLRELWSRDVLLGGLCALIYRQAGGALLQYTGVVSLQPRAANTLLKLRCPEASHLVPLLSLPVQRVTRLPLLLAAILRRLDQKTTEAMLCRAALDRLHKVVHDCNEAVRLAEHTELMTDVAWRLLSQSTSRKKRSWRERKNSVLVRAKSIFKSGNRHRHQQTSTDSLRALIFV